MKSIPPVVLVTGAGRGLGRGVALALAGAGYSVALNYAADSRAAQEALELCRKAAPYKEQKFICLQADIGVAGERNTLLSGTLSGLGRLDALVNNAGVAPRVRADITEAGEESFDRLLAVNLKGPYFLTQTVANYWLKEKPEPLLPGGFKVVFVGSISADTVSLNRGEYCISKAGLGMAAQLWAVRLAGEGIQVYELRPGIMETDMTRGVRDKYDRLIAEGLVPQRRWGRPEDLGKAVRALLAGDFSFSTGAVIYVDGGFNLKKI